MQQSHGVRAVKTCWAMVVADVVVVREVIAAFAIGHRFGPGIGKQEIQTVRNTLLQLHLKAVVTRVIAVADVVYRLGISELNEWPTRIKVARSRYCLVAVLVHEQ